MLPEMASYDVRRLARELEDILAADPDPVARPTMYLDERYRGPVNEDGIRLPDTRGRDAIDAGHWAEVEFRRNYKKPALSLFGDRKELERKFEEGSSEARKAGTRVYFEKFLAQELAAVSEPTTLRDLGTYLSRVAGGILGSDGVLSIIGNVVGANVTPEMIDRLSSLVLGVAVHRGYSPDDVIENKNQVFQEITEGLTSEVRKAIDAGVLELRDREKREELERHEAVRRARGTRYGRAADLLAATAEGEPMGPEEAAEMVAQVFIRTSEGHLKMMGEFRAALSERFADPGFGDRVVEAVVRLKHESERIREELDWNAGNG